LPWDPTTAGKLCAMLHDATQTGKMPSNGPPGTRRASSAINTASARLVAASDPSANAIAQSSAAMPAPKPTHIRIGGERVLRLPSCWRC
jgi:hypothetical protein